MVFGRDPLFKRILNVLHQNSLLLHGERRIGKTTVLFQLELRLHAADDAEYRFRRCISICKASRRPASSTI